MFKQLHYFKSWLLLMLCMVVGVGSASAADVTETIVLSQQGYENAQKVSSTSGKVVTLTYTDGGTATAYYNTGTGVRVYAGGKMTITADGKTITNVSITHSQEKTPTVSFSSNGTTTASSTGTPATWEGSATSVDFNVANKGHVRIQSVEVTYEAAAASETTTTVTIDDSDIDNTDVYTSTSAGSLAATVNDNAGQAISGASVTWSSSDEGVATIAANGAVTLVAAGTTTITASYAGVSGTYDPSSATYELTVTNSDPDQPGTVNNPYTVAQALAAQPAEGVYVQGTISSITEVSTQYKNATYTISDGTNEMLIYRGRYLDNADFTSADQIQLGDVVKVYGNLAVHNNANQMAQGNYIVNLTRKPTATLAFEQDSYEVAILGALTITATSSDSDGAITYESSDEDIAVIDETTGEVTATSAGVITITARIADTDSYKGTTATVQLTVIDPRQEVTLSFPTTPATINIGQEATYAVTSTPEGLEDLVAYTSSDDDIVSVDLGTGEITANAVGTATIIATFEGDSEYMAATASYTITVVDPSAPVEEWVLVDPSELTTGDVVVIVDQTSSKAMGNTGGTSSAPTATEVTLSTAKDKITSEVGEGIQWVVTVSGTDTKTYQFGVADTDNYLYTTTSNNGLRVGPSSTNDHNVCGIYDNEGVNFITITDVDNKTRYVGVYKSQDWRGYTSINTNIEDCVTAFYKKVATVPVTITSAGAASFSSQYALDFSKVSELTAYKATTKSDSYVHLDEVEQVPAGAGVIVKGAEGLYYVPVVTGDVAELEGNLLVGTGENTFTVTSAEYGKVFKYVKTNAGVVGFQKAKEGWTCQAGHAYLMLPTTPAREYLNIFGEEPIDDVATGINSIDNSQLTIDNDAPAYNLAGQKVGKGYKGIVVKNGKKVVIK